jgi:hypothetical protein
MTNRNHAVAQALMAGAASDGADSSGLSIELIDKQPASFGSTEQLTERTDLPVAGLPRAEPRPLPLWTRLRVLWHRQIVRDAQ